MKRIKILAVVTLLLTGFIMLAAMPVCRAATAGFPALEKFMKADFETKKKVVTHIRDNYPGLRKEVFDYVAKYDPKAPAKMRAAKMELIAKKYPGLPVKLTRNVLTDLEAKYPNLVLNLMVDVSGLIKDKYPTLPADVIKWKNQSGMKSATLRVIRTKHRGLLKDVMEVVKAGGYDTKLKPMRNDIRNLIDSKYPDLKMKIRAEVMELVNSKYPELPEKIAAIRENPVKNPRMEIPAMICKDYPGLVNEVLTMIRDNHGSEIHKAAMDVLELVDTKYSEDISRLQADIAEMIVQKHPTLLTDIGQVRMSCKAKVEENVKKKYPAFRSDVKKLVEGKYPDLGKTVMASVDKHYPNLRTEMADMMKAEFGTLMGSIKDHINQKHPKLIPEISSMMP